MAKIKITNPQQIINGGAKKYYFKVKGLGGPKGDQGEKGDPGSRGPQGLPGNAATVYVGSTTTLPVGQDATVENVGTQYNAVLNFGIPQGPRGPQGIQGERGEPGQTGQTGPRGPQGERGTNATVYIGTTSTLNPGTQATVYNSGTDSNAVLNFGIPRGEKGETGTTGATGPAGQNFTPTIVDSLPATGNQSNLYLTPKNYTTGTATGNPITISLGEDAGQISSAQIDGNTTQQTYTGKNLLAIENSVTLNGITTKLNDDGTITMTGTTSTSWGWNWMTYQKSLSTPLPAGTYTFSATEAVQNAPQFGITLWNKDKSANVSARIPSGSTSATVAVAFDAYYIGGAATGNPALGSVVNQTIGVQLEAGSTATSFEPYVGGVPAPNPDYPQPIQTVTGTQTVEVTGKNLLNPNMLHPVGYSETINGVTYTMMEDGGIKMKGTAGSTASTFTFLGVSWSVTTNQIPLDSSKTYMSSITRPSSAYRWFLRGLVNGNVTSLNSNLDSLDISNCSGITYAMVQVSANQSVDAVVYPQVELGSTATSFAKYSKQTLPISLGTIELCKLGDYQDYIYKSGDKWYVHKETGMVDLSTITWEAYAETLKRSASTNPVADMKYVTSNQQVGFGLTEGFIIRKGSGLSAKSLLGYFAIDTNRLTFNVGDGGSDPSGLLYYALATPTDTTITDQTLITQLEAVRNATLQASNTITNTATGTNLAGDLELGYCEYDPHNRYNKWLWLDINNNYEQLGS